VCGRWGFYEHVEEQGDANQVHGKRAPQHSLGHRNPGMPVLSRSLLLLIRSRLFVHWVSFDPGHTFAHPRTKAMLLTIAGRTCPYFPRQENTFLIFVLIFPSKKMKFLDEICGRVLTFPGTRTHSCFLLMFPYKEIKKLAGVSLLSQARQLSV
jgi:hypothetical protein